MPEEKKSHVPSGRIILISAMLLSLVLCAGAAFSPPYEGDAYDYGELAWRWVHHHDMTERHLRYFNIPGQAPTHPAGQRANYYTVMVAPFAAVFGRTFWTVFIPGLLSVLLIVFLVHRAGRDLFGPAVAWWAAMLCLFNPRLIYHALRDPTPESLLAALCLLSAWLFLKKRYPASGAVLGISFFVKQSAGALLPAYLIYLLLFDRKELARRGIWLGLAAFVLLASPFLIRNTIIFHNPLYTEETASRQHFNPQTLRDNNLLAAIFERGDQAPTAHAEEAQQSFLVKTLSLWDMNLHDNVIGYQNIDYYPGFLPLIYAACVPLFFAGLWFGRRRADVRLFALCILFYLAFHIFVVVHFETRYIFPTLPFGILIAVFGAFELKQKWPRFSARAALFFALFTGALATLPVMALQTTNRDENTRGYEYIAACRYLEKNSAPDSTVMAWPPFAATFFSDREAVPYVYGDLATQVRVLKKYHVDYVLHNDLVSAGEMPAFDFLTPVAKGKFMSLYKVDASAEGYADPAAAYPEMASYNPLEIVYKFTVSVPVRLDWPLEVYLSHLPGGPAQAAVSMLAIFLIFYILFTRKSRRLKIVSVIFLAVVCVGVRAAYLAVNKPPDMAPPPVNVMQARAVAGLKVTHMIVLGSPLSDYDYYTSLKSEFREIEFGEATSHPKENEIYLMPLRERGGALLTAEQVAGWKGRAAHITALETNDLEIARTVMLHSVRIGGALLLTGPGVPVPSSFAKAAF